MNVTFPQNTLVVVADGTQAVLYRNQSRDGKLKLEKTDELSPKNLSDEGPSGSRPPESSPQETDEATFAKQLAEYLYDGAYHKKFTTLVLVADPETLGQLRSCLHQVVKQCLIKEVNKTLTASSISDIERFVSSD